MFTGLIQHMGLVSQVRPTDAGVRLEIDPEGWSHVPSGGDSIAVSGCCLTVLDDDLPERLCFDVVPQTIEMTTLGACRAGDRVNLESAATMQSRLEGHVVQGHIEAVGSVASAIEDASGRRLRIGADAAILDLCVPQGSIAIDGVSLTVAALGEDWIEVALIPRTCRETTLGALRDGDSVNLETDVLARHVARFLRHRDR